MFADIVVLTPTDPVKKFFTYKIPNKLSKDILTGQLVSVPWGKKESQRLLRSYKPEGFGLHTLPVTLNA